MASTSVGSLKVKVVPDMADFIDEVKHAVPSSVVMQIMRRAAHDLVFRYSEWLDSQGLIVGADVSKDERSHDRLVADFLAQEQ